jgi:hypothetical protein
MTMSQVPVMAQDLQPMRNFMRPSLVANTVSSVRDILKDVSRHDPLVRKLLNHGREGVRRALVGCISRRVITERGQGLLDYMDAHKDTPVGEIAEVMRDRLNDDARYGYMSWAHERGTFRPIAPAPTATEDPTPLEEMLTMLEQDFPAAPLRSYADVREAEYRDIGPDDVRAHDGEPSIIQRTYDPSVISGETVEHAIRNDLDAFRAETKNGFFVFPFKEGGHQSVKHGFIQGFTQRPRRHMEHYRGKMLIGEDGQPRSWLTYNQMPDDPSEKCLRTIRDYLRKGVTGKVDYIDPTKLHQMVENAHLVQRFDTIWADANAKGAGLRLFAKATQDMLYDTPRLNDAGLIDLYVLRNLYFESTDADVHHLSRYPLPLGMNTKSFRFFTDYGLSVSAHDNGRKQRTERKIGPQQQRVFLRPEWQRMVGELRTVRDMAQQRWQEFMWSHGDYSEDI